MPAHARPRVTRHGPPAEASQGGLLHARHDPDIILSTGIDIGTRSDRQEKLNSIGNFWSLSAQGSRPQPSNLDRKLTDSDSIGSSPQVLATGLRLYHRTSLQPLSTPSPEDLP
jgi:hypothetical protein